MNDFLQNMQSLTLYKQLDKKKKENEKKDDLNDLEDDVRFEILKYKNATMSKHSNAKINSTTYNDYSSISELSSHKINATTNIKDTFAKENSLNNFTSKASETKGNISNTSNSNIGGSSSNLTGYSSAFSSAIGKTNIPSITQFGLIKMTGTEGNLQNGYTIGKDAKFRATASLEYVTRDENEKPISEIKDKNGNIISKVEAKEYMQTIHAERRLVLSPNPRLNLTEEQLDKVVRATMSSYSESFGKEFNYFYAIHNNTSTPHAHIIMTSNHPDGDGIKMYKDELFELKMNFEDNLKEVTKDYGINLKDVTTLPAAKQIANFIGAIPDTSIFNRNKFLAQKISKKFDLEFDSTHIGNNPQALENWFKNNDNSLKEYFMSATNKDAFLFQDYLNNAKDLSNKYDLGLNKETTTNINEFKIWLDNKQEIFLAERIAQDKNIFLKKEDVLNGNKLYKWFQENEKEIKEWNEVHKHFPSKQMSSLAQKYSEMIDNKPTNLLNNRKETRDFVRNYTRNPLLFAGDTRKALYSVLSIKKEQYKNETLENRITKSSSNNEIKRIESLQKRLALGQEISEGSLKRYNIDTKLFSIDSKEIKLDGINFSNVDIKQNLVSKISSHIQQLNKDFEDNKIDTEHYKIYSKKATALNHVISKSNNVSISALENIGLDKEKDLKEFKIDKVNTELRIINFKNSDLNNNMQDIKDIEKNNINRPLNHQIHMLLEISNKLNIKIGNIENISYKETNKFIDEHKNFNSYNSKNIIKLIKNIQNENISLKSNDLFLNSYIESINKNLGNLQNKILTGKNISLNEIKSTGIDPKELEISQGNLKIYVIANEKNNLKELEVLKNFSNEKEYRNFINDIENNKISKLNLNNSLANLTLNNTNIKSLPLDLKSNLLSNIKFEVKETTIDMIKINSLENLLNNKAKINETISNAIFNSPKYFNTISNELLVEHGIEIKTAKDLSNNFHKIGKPSELRNLITKTIQYHINEFRESNDLNNENDFNKYIEEINSNKQSKTILDLKQKELYGLNGFLSKNNGLYPIFESDMNKIGANTIDFNDKSTVKIKVEVIPNNNENKPLLLNAFKLMIGSSTNKINNLEINEIDALAINELNKNIKSKSEFKEATNEYIKTSINPKQSINYVSTILDNRTLNNMSYLIESNTIKDIPKNFLEARNIDTNNFEIEEKDKDVNTISMSSKNNLDQFKEFILNNNLENILNTQNELSTIHTGNEINPNYKIEINSFISQNHEITNSNVNEFNTLLSFAIEDKNIKLIDSLYKLDIESKNDPELLELKFISYAETLNISKDDIYYKMINQYFNINENELNAIDNLETTFNTLFELSNASTERIQLTPDDIKHQLYIENLVELVSQEYEQYQWKYFDMDNENVSENNMKAYFESTQDFRNEALKLNDLISEKLEIKELENQIKELLDNNNFKEAQELMQDERLEINTKNTFEFMHKNMLMNENILDEVYEKVIDNIKLEEKIYEIFKNDDDFINEMKKIDLEINMIDEINEELKQTELEEYELTLGGN